MNDNIKKDILLYSDSRFDENKNKIVLEATINFLKNSERFSEPLLNRNLVNYCRNKTTYKPITTKPLLVTRCKMFKKIEAVLSTIFDTLFY